MVTGVKQFFSPWTGSSCRASARSPHPLAAFLFALWAVNRADITGYAMSEES